MKTINIWIWEKEQCWHGDQTGGSQKYLVFNFMQLFKEVFLHQAMLQHCPIMKIKNHHHKTRCLPHFCFPSNVNDNRRKQTTGENGRERESYQCLSVGCFPRFTQSLPHKVTPTSKQASRGQSCVLQLVTLQALASHRATWQRCPASWQQPARPYSNTQRFLYRRANKPFNGAQGGKSLRWLMELPPQPARRLPPHILPTGGRSLAPADVAFATSGSAQPLWVPWSSQPALRLSLGVSLKRAFVKRTVG